MNKNTNTAAKKSIKHYAWYAPRGFANEGLYLVGTTEELAVIRERAADDATFTRLKARDLKKAERDEATPAAEYAAQYLADYVKAGEAK